MACTGGPRATHLSLQYTFSAHAPGVTTSGVGLQALRRQSMQAQPSTILADICASICVVSKQLFFRPCLQGECPVSCALRMLEISTQQAQ